MPTTAWLYATELVADSGTSYPGRALGAPNGGVASISGSNNSGVEVGGFGVQAAIGAEPLSIDAVEVVVRARRSSTAVTCRITVAGTQYTVTPGASLADVSVPTGVLTWEQLGTLTVEARKGVGAGTFDVDSVGVRVTYTSATPVTPTPIAGEGTTSLTATSLHAVALPVVGEGTTTLVVSYLPQGFVTLPVEGEGRTTLTATNVHAVSLPVIGEGVVQALVSNWHSIGLTPTVGEGAVRLSAHRLIPTIVRRPPRTLDQLITGSHRRADHVIIRDGARAGERLPLIGGTLTLDETDGIRATGSLQLPPIGWLIDYLDPLTTRVELDVVLAIVGDDGTTHAWRKAVVHATAMPIEVSATGGLQVQVQVADRADWISKAGMREHYAGRGATSIMTHAIRLATMRAPWLPIGDITDPGYTAGVDLLVGGVGEDPWTEAVRLAWSVGQRLYIDADGRLASQSVLMPDRTDARWVSGEAGCLISSMSTERSDAEVCNALGVEWEEPRPDDADEGWTPRGGVEWWVDVDGPLGTQGPLGERVRKFAGDTSVIGTPAHARDVAMSHGLSQQGVLLPLDFAVRCDPRLDIGSVVHVDRPEIGVAERCRISQLTYQLGGSLMGGSMGERRYG